MEKLKEECKNQIAEIKVDSIENNKKRFDIIQEMVTNLIRSNIEEVMGMEKSEKKLSLVLEEVYDKTEVFNPIMHFKLIDVLEKGLKVLCNLEDKALPEEQDHTQLKETITDFLYKFKDKHPFSNPEVGLEMDVFNRVMQFMKDNYLSPSDELQNEYAQSKTTQILNEIPSFEQLSEKIGITKEVYDNMMERYQSKSSFVYFFSPNLQIQIETGEGTDGSKLICIGFKEKGESSPIGAGLRIFSDGELQQAYFKDGSMEFYLISFRIFYPSECFYIGGYKQNKRHGKGEYVWEDGDRQVGNWVDGEREGAAKYYYKDGTEEDRVYKDGEEVEQ